jgi:hypothetical protein
MRPAPALGAIPATASRSLGVLDELLPQAAPGVLMPPGGAQLSDGRDRGGRGRLAAPADLRRLGPARVAENADVGGVDDSQGHEADSDLNEYTVSRHGVPTTVAAR